jgi:hypothetical protein
MTTTLAEILSRDKSEKEAAPLQLKQGGSKVFSKLFSRESSANAPSFRVYYGVASAGSVPFLWESQPGTPKNDTVSSATLPPLTPPPSYYNAKQQAATHKSAAVAATTGRGGKNNKQCRHGHGFFSAILPKIILHRRPRSSGSPTSSSCSSSAFSSSSSSLSFRSAQSLVSSSMRSRVFAFSAAGSDSEEEQAPATCFSMRHESFRAFKSCRVATTVRSALASVGGHAHGTTAAAQRV